MLTKLLSHICSWAAFIIALNLGSLRVRSVNFSTSAKKEVILV